MFRLTALGGTFDIIHVGHVGLIEKAVSISEKIIILSNLAKEGA